MCGCVYQIINKQNGKFLVGSTNNPHRRGIQHFSALRTGKHINPRLQRSWNKWGEDCFEFKVIATFTSRQEAYDSEQLWLDNHFGKDYCYNLNPDANVGGHTGRVVSEETRKRISEAMKGRKRPDLAERNKVVRHTKLTEFQMSVIKKCLALGMTNVFLGKVFQVSDRHISRIRNGYQWKPLCVVVRIRN